MFLFISEGETLLKKGEIVSFEKTDKIPCSSASHNLIFNIDSVWTDNTPALFIELGYNSIETNKNFLLEILERNPFLDQCSILLPKRWNNNFSEEVKKVPYIEQEKRSLLDEKISALSFEVKLKDKKAGLLNYIFTKLLLESYNIPEEESYQIYNEIEGLLGCCQKEFYRRFTAPYEDIKRKENGDVTARNTNY